MAHELLLVGGGRLARHLGRYLELEGIRFARWRRTDPTPFSEASVGARRILLLISDDAIERFVERSRVGETMVWIHCSGSLSTPLAEGAHPLMTFGDELYDLDTYRGITFVTERGRRPFSELLPELVNPTIAIRPEDKPLYHALCVLSGNGTTLLWRKAMSSLQALGVPNEAVLPYLDRIVWNLRHSETPLTGPLARGDSTTIEHNLRALEDDPYHDVYRALARAHREAS
jgi:predicted short-subunit dehydrogenase-like oxidoreductase (DUF2520 family)